MIGILSILGLDIGDEKIGIAISDADVRIATPLATIDNDQKVKNTLSKIIKDKDVDKIVIGLPLSLKGKENNQAKKVRDIVRDLDLEDNIEVVFYDERFTTKIVEKGLDRKNKKNMSDILAATLILNDYLEKEKNEK